MVKFDTFEERRGATKTTFEWVEQALGEDAANAWLMECTIFPVGLPTDEELDLGLSITLGDISIGDAVADAYRNSLYLLM